MKRFQQEINVASRLDHPNIVRMFDAGKLNNVRFMAMEYVQGIDLLSYIKERNRRLDVNKAIDYVLQAARGLEYAHQQGVIHRDIKPSNLLLDESRMIKILDLGLARVTADDEEDEDDENRLTVAGQMLGTARFMSPEQIEDSRTADLRSDIYSLGCTLHFLLRRRVPYSGDTMAHIMIAHMTEPIPSISEQRDDVSEEIDRIFERMVAKQPDDRYQSVTDLIRDLEQAMGLPPSTSAATDTSSVSASDTAAVAAEDPSMGGDVSFTEVSFDEQSRYNAGGNFDESNIEDVSEVAEKFDEPESSLEEAADFDEGVSEAATVDVASSDSQGGSSKTALIAVASIVGVAAIGAIGYFLLF